MTHKVEDHPQFRILVIIAIFVPIAGLIAGIIYKNKPKKIDKKLGEVIIWVSLFAWAGWALLVFA